MLGTFKLRKCDFIGKFSASGTKLDIRKLVKSFASWCQWTLKISQHAVQTW